MAVSGKNSIYKDWQNGSRAYDILFRWLTVAALICLGFVILWDYGLIDYLFDSDSSRISYVIIVTFLAYSAYCLNILFSLATELRTIEQYNSEPPAGGVHQSGLIAQYFNDLKNMSPPDLLGDGRSLLLEAVAGGFRRKTRVGNFAADLLYKLGMLGTVIGFVIMLQSMDDISQFDVDTLRDALQKMTGGMAVALLTTIAGLVSGILLRIQFNIADTAVSEILQKTIRITETQIVPTEVQESTDV